MPQNKYTQIYYVLKKRIESGEYPVGYLLPSENTLIEEFECSRNTVRRAIAGLVRDGYVQTRQGRGVYNIFHPLEPSAYTMGTIESFVESTRRTRQSSATRVILFSECTADDELAQRTGFAPGTALFYIQRLHEIDGIVRILNHNYFLKSAVPGLSAEIAAASIYEYLENTLHVTIVNSRRVMTVEKITEIDEKYLELDVNDYNCLAVISSHTYNSDGVMFEYTVSRHRPDYFKFQDNAVRRGAGNPG